MDIKTKLEEDIMFSKNPGVVKMFNSKGIFTIEDFINCDIEITFSGIDTINKFRGRQDILKYKYLGTPLLSDILLEKEYSNSTLRQALRDYTRLGFEPNKVLINIGASLIAEKRTCTMMELINFTPVMNCHYLQEFYKEYYKNHNKVDIMVNENIETVKKSVDNLKLELVSLVNKRNELDTKIVLLTEQINTLEGDSVTNGKY